MLIAMVIIFGTSWFPINLINLVADSVDLGTENICIFKLLSVITLLGCWPLYYLCFFICHIVAMSSTCYNPLLYGWLNSSFRTEFHKLCPCLTKDCGTRFVGIFVVYYRQCSCITQHNIMFPQILEPVKAKGCVQVLRQPGIGIVMGRIPI